MLLYSLALALLAENLLTDERWLEQDGSSGQCSEPEQLSEASFNVLV